MLIALSFSIFRLWWCGDNNRNVFSGLIWSGLSDHDWL